MRPAPIPAPEAGEPVLPARPSAAARGFATSPAVLGAAAVGVLAAFIALWSLDVSGFANTYYSAAAQAGAQSWSALFFGSTDAAGFITVDKPPASLWLMGLSVRLLGLSPMAVLLPEALYGVAAALFLYDAVRRQAGVAAATIAGVVLALTPVAALMFRYNNPDALLVLLLVVAAWAVVRGLERGGLGWLALAGMLVGLGFLTKYLQAFLVLPGFALTWLVAGPGGIRRRLVGLAVAGLATVAASAWWVAIVELIPAGSRPYIGGSTNNSVLDLVFGYDGLGRIFGQGGPGGGPGGPGPGGAPFGGPGGAGFGGGLPLPGAVGGPGGFGAPGAGAGFGGAPGPLRMFNEQWGTQISWFLPSAAIGLVVGFAVHLRDRRSSPILAAVLLWGSWLLVHVTVFSLMSGIAHSYYSAAIAPAAAGLTGIGLVEGWRLRDRVPWGGLAVGALLLATAWWHLELLDRVPAFAPGLGIGILLVALAASIVLVVPATSLDLHAQRMARVGLVAGLVAILVGPAAWTAATMTRPISGGDPSAGPTSDAPFGPGGPRGFAGDPGGTDQALVDYLVANRGTATWLVAVSSAAAAGPLQLSTGIPVMAMGGFMGADPAPTLEQLQADIHAGRLRFVLLGGRGGGPGGVFGGDGQGGVASERNGWVQSACRPVPDVGDGNLYDCAGVA